MLREGDLRAAEDKYQVSLLLATVHRLCSDLTNFMTATENELKRMNSEQLRTLNVQEQYKREFTDEVDKILKATYGAIRENQATAMQTIMEQNQKAMEKMNAETKSCTHQITKTAERAENALKSLFRFTRLEDARFQNGFGW